MNLLHELVRPLAIKMADINGGEVTEHLGEVWEREREIQELANRLADLGAAARKIPRRRRKRGERKARHGKQAIPFEFNPLRLLMCPPNRDVTFSAI